MKYLIVNDENELYRRMYADLFSTELFDVEEISRIEVPLLLKPFCRLHYSDKINRRVNLPFKMMWKPFYKLHKYPFDFEEQYCIIFLNGSLRYYFDIDYIKSIKARHNNVKFALIMYDNIGNPDAKRSTTFFPYFDYVFSFDGNDCIKNGFERIYSTFSKPDFVKKDVKYRTDAYFVGQGTGRLQLLQDTLTVVSNCLSNCKFYIVGVKQNEERKIPNVIYNVKVSYREELQMAYNTNCIIEVVKNGQTGITLRTCEAISFNKKLLTNNTALKEMPFYDERYMYVFDDPKDINPEFLKQDIDVKYENNDYFSPLNILRRIEDIGIRE